ncbi:MAG: Crp/Fnr family transcriptional regulator [Azonexus sp.]|nr:Crp/Fnr family transcriptional regulator [Azonexus sp.]
MRDHQTISVETHLSHVPLFEGLHADEIALIAKGTREIHAKKGEVLFHRGDACTGFHVMVYGQVKLVFSSSQGTEKVVEVIREGQSFGEALMFLEKPYIVSAHALNDSLLLYVSKSVIFDEIARDHSFARKMLGGMAMRLHQLITDVEAYSLQSGTQRIIGYLLRELPEWQLNASDVVIELPVNKGVIASRLNLTQEHFSRILHELSSLGLILVEGRRIHIPSVSKLSKYQI